MKKTLITFALIFTLSSCANESSQQPIQENEVIENESIEEVENIESIEDNDKEVSEENDPNYIPEYAQVINSVTQSVQDQPGTNEQSNYFNINGLLGDYEQTGDAFITTHKYEPETKIILIPVKVTNKYKEATTISTLTTTELRLIQEDKNSIYQCTSGVTPPDQFKNDITTKIKVGGSMDYYLAYKVEKEDMDFKLVSGLGEHIVFAELINQ
ncbi:hypothetical protein [Anaerococcus cruorum]|uniref:DUF4352 domain-containing protein n=1 Tax=Anaerococcus cruorum TaxID=3115617 RepID=A0ABW9MWB2_9FIRM